MTHGSDTVVEARGLSKKFGDVTAVSDVSFEVARGSVVGVLGRNGAGKSTLVSMLVGLTSPSSGSVQVLGCDPRAARSRSRLGVVPQDVALPGNLTAYELGAFVSAHFPSSSHRYQQVLHSWGIKDFCSTRIRRLSGGQRRRVAVGLAFVGNPLLVVLDEPTTGLDPESRRAMWSRIREEASRGMTVVITSHYLEEIEYLSDHILLMEKGTLIENRSISSFLALKRQGCVSFVSSASVEQVRMAVGRQAEVVANHHAFKVRSQDTDGVVRALVHSGLEFQELRVTGWSLEDVLIERMEEQDAHPQRHR
ncbi:ABC transporter ATP-binding protein [Actinomyces wuliandei]|uniref:ABC transporter ATP-binding protein n=1 Tax=Actinomyces wuliandei TaxID=2057743 RepID=UPI0013E35B55|nr:ABC transporter ATP-binding protein [Actinomyces wuliandei]